MNNTLSIKECLGKGWALFKSRPWFFIGTFVLYAVVQIVLSSLQEGMPGFLSFIVSVVVSTFLGIGLINVYLKAYENPASARFSDFWLPKPFWNYLGTSILLLIIVVVGLVLLIVPGVIAALALSFACYLVVDRGLAPVAALKESARITKGNRWKLLLLGIVLALLSIVGFIALVVGILVVAPISLLAAIHAYRTLSHVVAEVVPAPTAVGS